MLYSELLLHPNWLEKRREILRRDKQECEFCKNSFLDDCLIDVSKYLKRWKSRDLLYKTGRNEEFVIFYKWLLVNKVAFKTLMVHYLFDTEGRINVLAGRRCKKSDNLSFEIDNVQTEWIFVKNLHIHHKYYQKEKLPWEYPDNALVTLCWSCHEKLHATEKVPFYDENMRLLASLTPCKRCFGAGVFPEYNHVQSGVCFRCNGAKYEEFICD